MKKAPQSHSVYTSGGTQTTNISAHYAETGEFFISKKVSSRNIDAMAMCDIYFHNAFL